MLVSLLSLVFLFAGPSLAAPIPGFFDRFENATLSGVASTVLDSVTNPKLTAARIKVAKNLAETKDALTPITQNTENTAIANFATKALQGLSEAASAVDRIGQALITGQTPAVGDQKSVAEGIKRVQDGIQCMQTAEPAAQGSLGDQIANAAKQAGELREGGESVISIQGKSLTDLGLPADFATAPVDCQQLADAATRRRVRRGRSGYNAVNGAGRV